MTIFDDLAKPFPPDRVSWRVGPTNRDKTKGMALAYIDARDVMERLDAVAGPAGWQCRYPHANGKTVCEVGLFIEQPGRPMEWIWKADGAGDTDMEASKGALSDAFKRAAVRWGIGRYLYDISSPWVEIEAHGKSFVIKESELLRLRKLLAGQAPAPAQTNVSLDSQAAANDLIHELQGFRTVKRLHDWGESPAIQEQISRLAATDADRVRTEYKAQLTALKKAETIAA